MQPGAVGGSGTGPSATQAFGYAWALAKKDFAGVILPLAVGFLVTMLINIGMNLLLLPIKAALGIKAGLTTALGVGALMDAVVAVPATAVSAFLGAGFYLFASRLVRGQKPAFADVFSGGPVFVPALFATLATIGVPTILRPLLSLVPFVGWLVGLLWLFAGGLAWPWALAVTIDRNLGPADAVTAGWAEAFKAPGTSLLIMLFGGLGVLACCVGAFVTMPLMYIAVAYVYHTRKGDAVALTPVG